MKKILKGITLCRLFNAITTKWLRIKPFNIDALLSEIPSLPNVFSIRSAHWAMPERPFVDFISYRQLNFCQMLGGVKALIPDLNCERVCFNGKAEAKLVGQEIIANFTARSRYFFLYKQKKKIYLVFIGSATGHTGDKYKKKRQQLWFASEFSIEQQHLKTLTFAADSFGSHFLLPAH
jgi:hypothetical protein